MSIQLSYAKIRTMEIKDLFEREIIFINPKTGRKKKGRITKISDLGARVLDKSSLGCWVYWKNIFIQKRDK